MTTIYNETIKHFDNDGDLLPEPGAGTDTHSFTIPANQKFSHFTLESQQGTWLGGCSVAAKPAAGATGTKKIKVKWWHAPFGQVHYQIVAHAVPKTSRAKPAPHTIVFPAPGWLQSALVAIDQGIDFKLVIEGPAALELFQAMKSQTAQAAFAFSASVVVAVAITAAVAFTIVSLAAFATIGAVLIIAMQNDYDATAAFKANADPLKSRLEITVTKAS